MLLLIYNALNFAMTRLVFFILISALYCWPSLALGESCQELTHRFLNEMRMSNSQTILLNYIHWPSELATRDLEALKRLGITTPAELRDSTKEALSDPQKHIMKVGSREMNNLTNAERARIERLQKMMFGSYAEKIKKALDKYKSPTLKINEIDVDQGNAYVQLSYDEGENSYDEELVYHLVDGVWYIEQFGFGIDEIIDTILAAPTSNPDQAISQIFNGTMAE